MYFLWVFCIPIFPFFQPLLKVPKLFTPAVTCPKCACANDENFRFCQQCGYARRLVFVPDPPPRVEIDETMIWRTFAAAIETTLFLEPFKPEEFFGERARQFSVWFIIP